MVFRQPPMVRVVRGLKLEIVGAVVGSGLL